jgi:hypothetical protein
VEGPFTVNGSQYVVTSQSRMCVKFAAELKGEILLFLWRIDAVSRCRRYTISKTCATGTKMKRRERLLCVAQGRRMVLLCNSSMTRITTMGAAFTPTLMDARAERVRASARRWRVAGREAAEQDRGKTPKATMTLQFRRQQQDHDDRHHDRRRRQQNAPPAAALPLKATRR